MHNAQLPLSLFCYFGIFAFSVAAPLSTACLFLGLSGPFWPGTRSSYAWPFLLLLLQYLFLLESGSATLP